MDEGHETAEQAALAGYSAAACARVRASALNAELGRAVLVIDTEPSHPLEVDCVREGGRWFGGNSGNGWTWARVDGEGDIGYQTAWDEVSEGVTAVRIEFRGRLAEVPVTNGMFLFVDWHVSEADSDSWPHVVGYLGEQGWQELSIDPGQRHAERMLRARPPVGWRRLLPRWWPVKRIGLKSPGS